MSPMWPGELVAATAIVTVACAVAALAVARRLRGAIHA